MKIFVKLIGFFAFLIIIGLIVSCDIKIEESEPYYYDELREAETQGRLTITGLDDYNGKIISGYQPGIQGGRFDDVEYLKAGGKVEHGYLNGEYVRGAVFTTSAIIADGQSTLKVYNYFERSIFYGNYSGNEKNILFEVYIYITDDDYGPTAEGTITVDFTNGIGNGVFIPNTN